MADLFPPADRRRRVPLRTKLAFASGSIEEAMVTAAGVATMIYYNQVLGVSPALCGLAFLIASIADAVSDPLVGAMTDAIRTRWGRRHPLMLASALPIAAAFYAIYQPPSALNEHGLFLWLTGALVVMGIAKDFYALPHNAMGAELTDDYNERTSIFGWNYITGALAGMLIGAFILAVLFPSTPQFANGLLNPVRYPLLAGLGAVVCAASVIFCTLATWDQIPFLHTPPPRTIGKQYREAAQEIWRNLKALGTNISYLSVCLCWFVLAISGGILGVVGAYAMLYGFEFTTEQMAIQRFVTLPGVLLSVPLALWLSRRLDKKYTVIAMIALSCLLVGSPYVLKLLGVFPPTGSAVALPLFFALNTLAYVALPVVPIVINSQMVDIADEHELKTGNRAEGLIFSVRLFALKATNGLGAMVAGVGLEAIGFPQNARPETLSPKVIDGLMFMMGPLYYIIVFAGLGFALLYRIDRRRHGEILAELEARRADRARMEGAPNV